METIKQADPAMLAVSGGEFGDMSVSCCEFNFFGVTFSVEVFDYSLSGGGALTQSYGFERYSAYNRL